jgi:hypothetical protein
MDGPGVSTLLTSHSRMISLANELIQACPKLSLVRFMDYSYYRAKDDGESVGLLNGKVQRFQCKRTKPQEFDLPWGFQHCEWKPSPRSF